MTVAARSMPALMESAALATKSAAPVLSSTASRLGPCVSPARMERMMPALVSASPPARSSSVAGPNGRSAGLSVAVAKPRSW